MPESDQHKALLLVDASGDVTQATAWLHEMDITHITLHISLSTDSAKAIATDQFQLLCYYFSPASKLLHIHWLLTQLHKRRQHNPLFIILQACDRNQALSLLQEKHPAKLQLTQEQCNKDARNHIDELISQHHLLAPCYLALEQDNYIKTIELAQQQLSHSTLTTNARSECWRLIAEGYYHLGQFAKALASCDHAHTEDQQLLWPYTLRGHIQLQQQNYSAADQELTQALALDPQYVIASDALSHSYLQQNRFKEAQKLIGQAVDISPANMNRLEHLNFIANLNDDPETATAAMRRLKQVAEASQQELSTSQWLNFAKSLCAQVDYNKSGHDAFKELAELIETKLQFSGEDKDLHARKYLLQGNFSSQLKDKRTAHKNYQQAEALYDNHYHQFAERSHVDLAQEFYESDYFIAKGDIILRELLWRYRDDSAIFNHIQLFFKSDPFLAAEANTLGIRFYNKKRYPLAAQLLDLAADMRPDNSAIQLNAIQANLALLPQINNSKKEHSYKNTQRYFNSLASDNNLNEKHKQRFLQLKKQLNELG